MNTKKQIIIAGAGFGGLAVAQELAKHLKDSARWQVLVIDKNNKQIYHPLLYEVASGRASGTARDNRDLTESSSILYDFLFEHLNQELVKFVQGEIIKIDRAKREVHLADGQMPAYEYLVGAF